MPNAPYLDASVRWKLKSGAIAFREPRTAEVVAELLDNGLVTEVLGTIGAGKEADVFLARDGSRFVVAKSYRLYPDLQPVAGRGQGGRHGTSRLPGVRAPGLRVGAPRARARTDPAGGERLHDGVTSGTGTDLRPSSDAPSSNHRPSSPANCSPGSTTSPTPGSCTPT